MPAYNFKPEFALLVESGVKRQTIRRVRKRPTDIGETLFLYEGMRTKNCRLLKKTICLRKESIVIENHDIYLNGRALKMSEILDLSWADGFETIGEFINFFKKQYGLPFEGEIIKWCRMTHGRH